MEMDNDELLRTLREIRDLLVPISACFEDQYLEIQKQKFGEKLAEFEAMLTPIRKEIFPLLFDPRHLSQVEIANEVNTSQPTVSRFVSTLLKQGLIGQTQDENGNILYKDKYSLAKLVQK